MSLLQILDLIQKRVSFFSIFNIFEDQLLDELNKKEAQQKYDFMKKRLEKYEQTLHLVVDDCYQSK